jgi:hypothetical protein
VAQVLWQAVARELGCAPAEVNEDRVWRALTSAKRDADHWRQAHEKQLAQRMMEAMHPKPSQGEVTEEDAARLIMSKMQPDAVERFGLARELAPPGMSDASIMAALMTQLCNTNEQHTGDYEAINQNRISLPATGGRTTLAPQVQPVPFGREPRPCGTCGAVFTPVKQGQRYGCQACGEYPNYLERVRRDREVGVASHGLNGDPQRQSESFELYCLRIHSRCECPGVVQPLITLTPGQQEAQIQLAAMQRIPETRPRVLTTAQGVQMVVDEPVGV